jgi:hypothetical protein
VVLLSEVNDFGKQNNLQPNPKTQFVKKKGKKMINPKLHHRIYHSQ